MVPAGSKTPFFGQQPYHKKQFIMIICNHCVKSVQIWSYFWSVFPRIRTEYGRIQSECGKIRTRNNSVFGQFSRSVYIMLLSELHLSKRKTRIKYGVNTFELYLMKLRKITSYRKSSISSF